MVGQCCVLLASWGSQTNQVSPAGLICVRRHNRKGKKPRRNIHNSFHRLLKRWRSTVTQPFRTPAGPAPPLPSSKFRRPQHAAGVRRASWICTDCDTRRWRSASRYYGATGPSSRNSRRRPQPSQWRTAIRRSGAVGPGSRKSCGRSFASGHDRRTHLIRFRARLRGASRKRGYARETGRGLEVDEAASDCNGQSGDGQKAEYVSMGIVPAS